MVSCNSQVFVYVVVSVSETDSQKQRFFLSFLRKRYCYLVQRNKKDFYEGKCCYPQTVITNAECYNNIATQTVIKLHMYASHRVGNP